MALSLTKTSKASKTSKGKPGDKTTGPAPLSKRAQAEYDRPFVAVAPIVNLLPPELQDAIERLRLKKMFALLAVGLLVLLAAAWTVQGGLIAAAQKRLDAEQSVSTQLAAEQASLAPIRAFYGQIEANTSVIQSTMASEVLTSEVISELDAATPPSVRLDSFGLTLSGGGSTTGAADPNMTTSTCPSEDPYASTQATAGCINVSGSADNRVALGEWLDNLEARDMFTVAFIPSTTADPAGGEVTFSATIGLDAAAAFKNRYADPEFLKAGAN